MSNKTKNQVLSMILDEDNSVIDLLTTEAKYELFLEYIAQRDEEFLGYKYKTEQAADLYKIAKQFGVHRALPLLCEYLGVPKSTLDKRLHMARIKGFLDYKKGGPVNGTAN